MNSFRNYLALAFTSALLMGCANGFQTFYTDALKGQPITSIPTLIPYAGPPEIYRGTNPDDDALAMVENGYALVGYSSFNGPMNAQNDPGAQARKVRAAVVLVYGNYTNTITGSIPYTVYSPGRYVTSTTTGSVYGTGGSAGYTETTSTYVPGTPTTYQNQYKVDRYDQSASFWVKTTPPRLGVFPRDLTPQERNTYQRNRGVVAAAVTKGSPAFLADLLRGDVLVRIGSDDIVDAETFYKLLDKYEGQQVDLGFLRDGNERTITLRINTSR